MVKWNADKGFGFIKPDDGGEDLFCHVSSLLDGDGSVRDGDAVTFKKDYDDRKGKDRAIDVEVSGGGGGRKRSRSRSGGRGGRGGRGRESRSPPRRGGGRDDRGGGGRGESKAGEKGTGEIVRWNSDKGFGFMKPDNGSADMFVHVSDLLDGDGSVLEGDRVTFEVAFDDRKGKDHAVKVAVEGGVQKKKKSRRDRSPSDSRSRSPPRRRR